MLFTDYSIILNNDEMEHPFPNGVCAFLPEIPNVKMNMIVVTDSILEGDKYTEYVQMIEGAPRRDHKTSTCLMLFCKGHNGRRIGSDMASIANIGNVEKIVSLWGVVVQKIQTNNESPYCVAILITGSIQTWSIVVSCKYQIKEQVEEKLKLFKEQVKLQKYSVGFMFANEARRANKYHEKNMESTIFKRLFPKVPFVGCSSDEGTFGKDTTIYKSESVYKQDHCNFATL